ncbi:MAG: type 4a pilus biogenesis protein PilO [Candidatus Marinimicrobia bacterium]|nr:type 4a pilus biogenesis protein PilO [Candidatus Neomarinimicrobiota bacterium]
MNIDLDRSSGLLRNIFKPTWFILAIFIYSATITMSNLVLIKPQVKRFKSLEAKKNEMDSVLDDIQLRDIDKTISFLEEQINYYTNEQKIFKNKIIDRQNISQVLGELTRLVSKSGLNLNYIDPLPPSSKIGRNYQKLPITIRLSGSYKDFIRFLNTLSTAQYWLLIDNYDISNTKTLEENNYTVNIYTIVK